MAILSMLDLSKYDKGISGVVVFVWIISPVYLKA